ncbi:MAG: hypothetical protein M3Q97_09225 [Bacteroidota bacterium]|nr:hypothetical protein [Bacteroidota bacterium]
MDAIAILLDIVKLILPALVVFATVYFMLKKFFDFEQKRKILELRMTNQRTSLPIRLQAYERLALLLERLSVNSLILRVKKGGMTASDLQVALLSEIRAEFDHNLSQQIYVSAEAWQNIVAAKEATAKLINIAYGTVTPQASAMDLSKMIFEKSIAENYPPTYRALLVLKKEAQEMM